MTYLLVARVEKLWLSFFPAGCTGIWLLTEKAWGPVEALLLWTH